MNSTEFLKHLITEELYIIPDSKEMASKESGDKEVKNEGIISDLESDKSHNEKTEVSLLIEVSIEKEQERDLLSKVLAAVGFQMDQVTLVDLNSMHHYTSKKTIVFNDQNDDFYLVKNSESGVEILNSRSLSTLSQSIEDKKSLWAALKKWFEV